MGFHFWQAHQQITGKYRLGQIQRMEAGGRAHDADAGNFIQIQIREHILKIPDGLKIAGGIGQIECIAAMAGTFGDAHIGGAEPAERLQGRMDKIG
jgi:hypothetical protein